VALRPNEGHALLIIDDSRSHYDTPRSVGLIWTSARPVAETSARQHATLKRDILGKERDNLILGVAKTDNWPLSKSRLIRNHFQLFSKFIHEISLEKLNEA
jgi:hypothetical protein